MILLKKKKLFKNSLIYSVMNTLAKRKEKKRKVVPIQSCRLIYGNSISYLMECIVPILAGSTQQTV